jgi:hypothetical protein
MVHSFNGPGCWALRLIDRIQLKKCGELLKIVDAFVSAGRSGLPVMVHRSCVVLNLVEDCENTHMF